MSNQQAQRMRRMGSPSTKQGPIKAILPFGLKPGSPTANAKSTNTRKTSPSTSPTPQWSSEGHRKNRRSPDNRVNLSPDRAGSNSPGFKEKGKHRHSPASAHMKRTGSFDAIAAPYLKGEWPKPDVLVPLASPVIQCCDKTTQTPDEWEELASERKKKHSHRRSSSLGNGDNIKEKFKARIAKNKDSGGGRGSSGNGAVTATTRNSPVQASHQVISTTTTTSSLQSKSIAVPQNPALRPPMVRMRGSVEGPSSEIERIYRNSGFGEERSRTQDLTPEGRRAPVRDLLAGAPTRSVNTQTPLETDNVFLERGGDSSRGPPTDDSASQESSPSDTPLSFSPTDDDQEEDGGESSPQLSSRSDSSNSGVGTKEEKDEGSPDTFSFIREPPDGAEKIPIIEEPSSIAPPQEELAFHPIKKPADGKCVIPSDQSAFLPLSKYYISSTPQPIKTKGMKEDLMPPTIIVESQSDQFCQ